MIRKLLNKIFNRIHFYRHMRPSNIDSVFVVSTGRTGTKFFESFFNIIDEKTFAVHEPRPDFFDLGMNKLRKGWAPKQVEDYIKARRGAYLRQHSENRIKRYVECNPFLPVLLNEIKGVFKKSKFIIVTRGPKSYVKSALNKSSGDDGKNYAYAENDKRKRLQPSDFPSDPYRKYWSKFSRIEKFSWYWNKCNMILMSFYNQNKSVCLSIKFEELFSENRDCRKKIVMEIIDFLEISVDFDKMEQLIDLLSKKENYTQVLVYGGFEEWSDYDKKQFFKLTEEANSLINQG